MAIDGAVNLPCNMRWGYVFLEVIHFWIRSAYFATAHIGSYLFSTRNDYGVEFIIRRLMANCKTTKAFLCNDNNCRACA